MCVSVYLPSIITKRDWTLYDLELQLSRTALFSGVW